VVANACQNQDLSWALRGRRGGTLGVVTKVTLMTLPTFFGFASGTVKAKTDAALKAERCRERSPLTAAIPPIAGEGGRPRASPRRSTERGA
jgi:hypothetical protein